MIGSGTLMTRTALIFLFFLLVLAGCFFENPGASAQNIVNVEAVRPRVEDLGYKGEARFELNGGAGNSDRIYGGLGHSSVWNSGLSQQFILVNYRYGESQGIKDTSESLVHLRHVRPVAPLRFWEGYIQSQTNQFNRLRFRGLAGGGWRWELPEIECITYALGAGVYYSHDEVYETGLLSSEQENTARANFYFSLRSTDLKDVTAIFVLYFQPKVEQLDDYLLLSSGILKMNWTENLALALEATVTHDNYPPATVKKTDMNYISSLVVKF